MPTVGSVGAMATAAVTADGRARVLADGNEIPLLALGVWQVPDGSECENAVRWALELGYRHIDTAQAYRNEASVGRALRDSGVPRDEVFITTKFHPDRKDPEAEVQRSLERLGVDQVDLYIIHWPGGGPRWAWPGMERAHERGFARSIGVSNFSLAELDQLLPDVTTPPVINQVQFSPFEFRRRLLEGCEQRSVALEAYSPPGTGRHLRDRRVRQVAERLGRTPAQVQQAVVLRIQANNRYSCGTSFSTADRARGVRVLSTMLLAYRRYLCRYASSIRASRSASASTNMTSFSTPPARIRPSWRRWVPRNQSDVRPFTDRT
jgi:diketogulonate reductase-like aldo/keto reductase